MAGHDPAAFGPPVLATNVWMDILHCRVTISPPFNPLYWWDQGPKTVRWTRKILNSAKSLWLFKEPLKIPSWLPWGKDFSSKSYLQMAENGKPILPIWCHSKCWSQCLICQKNEKTQTLRRLTKWQGKVKSEAIGRDFISSTQCLGTLEDSGTIKSSIRI